MLYSFFWVITGFWILCADVSEHSVSSETSARKIQTPVNHPKERFNYILKFELYAQSFLYTRSFLIVQIFTAHLEGY